VPLQDRLAQVVLLQRAVGAGGVGDVPVRDVGGLLRDSEVPPSTIVRPDSSPRSAGLSAHWGHQTLRGNARRVRGLLMRRSNLGEADPCDFELRF
jgi:hypothetical protein